MIRVIRGHVPRVLRASASAEDECHLCAGGQLPLCGCGFVEASAAFVQVLGCWVVELVERGFVGNGLLVACGFSVFRVLELGAAGE